MPQNLRPIAFWLGVFLLLTFVFNTTQNGAGNGGRETAMDYTEFVRSLEEGKFTRVAIEGERAIAETGVGETATTIQPVGGDLAERAVAANVPLDVASREVGVLGSIIGTLLPFILLIGVWLFIMNRMQGGKGGLGGFGKAKVKLLTEHQGKITFQDVAGIDEAKGELEEIVDFLRDSERFSRLGAKIPKGALLVGPPGTGKTLLARAVAGEAGVPFFSISGSDFVEMFVGVGASRVRDMFEQAKKNAPCILFIDEIDAVGRARGVGIGGGNDEREQTLNQMLVEMDGFEANEGIIILAATNRPDVLDPALLRPGRFDRQVQVPNPDVKGREAILSVHARKVPIGPDVDLRTLARGTPGFSGADLANLVNEAALVAARTRKRFVGMTDFEQAKDRVMMGAERKSLIMSEDERKLTAYHEAGHAIVGLSVPQHDPIHKATIVPRGRALGMVMSLPERDQISVSRTKYTSKIAMAMGGKVAEELIFGEGNVTSGATSDIQQVTRIARAMVTQFGFSDKLGHVNYANQRESYLGAQEGPLAASEETQRIIDSEVRQLVDDGYETAKQILTERMEDLHRLANGLLEHETLTGEQITRVVAGDHPNKEGPAHNLAKPGASGGIPKIGRLGKGGGTPALGV